MADDMRDVILTQPEQITHSLEVNKDISVEGDFDSIILAGMGGSGHPGDLLNALAVPNVPLFVHRNYDLPADYLRHLNLNKPLLFASSYSGNTEEPLTSYKAAQQQDIPIMASAAGGQLQQWAERDGVPFCLIDYPGMQPRHTLLAAFTGIATALANSSLAEDITNALTAAANMLEETTPALEEPAKQLAHQLKMATPVYVSSDALGFAAKNFKIQTNENAKSPGFWSTFPELNHNELVGFSKLKEISADCPTKFHVVMLRDDDDHPRIRARMDVSADLYRDWGADVSDFKVKGATHLEKILYATTFGLWTTYFLALEHNIDPTPVEGVEDFKAKLKEVAGDISDS